MQKIFSKNPNSIRNHRFFFKSPVFFHQSNQEILLKFFAFSEYMNFILQTLNYILPYYNCHSTNIWGIFVTKSKFCIRFEYAKKKCEYNLPLCTIQKKGKHQISNGCVQLVITNYLLLQDVKNLITGKTV